MQAFLHVLCRDFLVEICSRQNSLVYENASDSGGGLFLLDQDAVLLLLINPVVSGLSRHP